MKHYHKDHYNNASLTDKNQVRVRHSKTEFLNDDGKSAVMMMRRRPLADCSRLELRQLEKARLPTVDSLMGGTTNWLVLADAELADQESQRHDVPNITVHCREEVCKLATRLYAANVPGSAASAVTPTHQRCGHMDADGR